MTAIPETANAGEQRKLRDPKGLWAWLRVFIVLYLIASIALTVSNAWFEHLSIGTVEYTPVDMTGVAVVFGLLGASVLYTLFFVVCIVLTCRITYRMMKNLHEVNAAHVTISPGWAWGYYFIPFANLALPAKAVKEIWQGTFSELEGEPPRQPGGAIGWWWSCWLIANFADNIGGRIVGDGFVQAHQEAASADQVTGATVLWTIGEICTVLACIFMIRLFGRLVKAQSGLVGAAALS